MENHLQQRNLYLQDMIGFMNLFFTLMVTLLENRRPRMCMNVFYQNVFLQKHVALHQHFTVHQNVFQKKVLQQTVLKQHVL